MALIICYPDHHAAHLVEKLTFAQPYDGGNDAQRPRGSQRRRDGFTLVHGESQHVTISTAEHVERIRLANPERQR